MESFVSVANDAFLCVWAMGKFETQIPQISQIKAQIEFQDLPRRSEFIGSIQFLIRTSRYSGGKSPTFANLLGYKKY